ncbi:MAG: Gldg family protein [Magnetococcales bacterium]|nr:Gldg family protein [Magnetococcales bacterium]
MGGRLLLAAAVFFAVNILANSFLRSARLDLTANKLYTLSEGTRHILANLQEPVELWFFVSRSLTSHIPGLGLHVTRIRDLLDTYLHLSGNKLHLTVVNPEPFSAEEDLAMDSGLRGISIPTAAGKIYLGLVARHASGRTEAIPFLLPAWGEQLEYDLTSLLFRLARTKRPVLGLLSTLPLAGVPSSLLPDAPPAKPPWAIHKELEKSFTIKTIQVSDDKIPDDVDLLMVVHPRELPRPILDAVDQHVLRGKPTVMFADPYCQAQENATPWLANSLPNALLSGWGVEILREQVAADLQSSRQVRFNSLETGSTLINYPVWIDLGPGQMNSQDPVTAYLDRVTLATAGIISPKSGHGLRVEPLLMTGKQGSWFDMALLGPTSSPQRLIQEYRPKDQAILAARIHGPFASAFPAEGPDNNTSATTAPDHQTGHLRRSTEPIKLVLVADSDLLQDQFWVRKSEFLNMPVDVPYTANGRLVMNILDDLLARTDLVNVRNQGYSQAARPFVRLQAIRQQAELRFQEMQKVLNQRMQETQKRFVELQNQGRNTTLNPAQVAEIEKFRQELLTIRKELRDVQRHLTLEVERLQTWIKFFVIGLAPLLVGMSGVLVGMRRLRRARSVVANGGS